MKTHDPFIKIPKFKRGDSGKRITKAPCSPKRRVLAEDDGRSCRQDYWSRLFSEISGEVAIPYDKRREYVQSVLEPQTFHQVEHILKFVKDDTFQGKKHRPRTSGRQAFEEPQLQPGPSLRPNQRKVNPYINFLRKDPIDARIWCEKPIANYLSKPLVEKSEKITASIVDNFYEWFKTIGDEEDPKELHKKNLLKMFSVGTNEFAKKAMCISMKELASVPLAVALSRDLIEKSERAVLRQHLMNDILSEKLEKRTTAFNRALPRSLAFKPPNNRTFERWIDCPHIRRELTSMEYVFKGIEHISSVRAYCKWLYENPELLRPKYLVDLGLITADILEKQDSLERSDSIMISKIMLAEKTKPKNEDLQTRQSDSLNK